MEKTRFNFVFRKRGDIGVIVIVPTLILFCLSRPLWPLSSVATFVLEALGWFYFALYITFRLWATLYVGGRKDENLLTQGPYSITRNPLYLGSFFLGLSLVCFLKSLTLFLALLVTTAIYSTKVVKIEEIFLEKKFGEKFRNYCRITPRFLPTLNRHYSEDFISIEFTALRHEARRLWASALIPLAVYLLMALRTAPGLPHPWVLP